MMVNDGYPLVIYYNELERSTIFNGKIHYFDWAIFNSYVTNYQRLDNTTENIWVLIKIKVSGAATIADQPRINRDTNGVNRGRVLSYATLFCAENRQNIARCHKFRDNRGC